MVDTFSTRRVLTLTSLILIILLATFGSRPSVKRALVSYLSPGRLLRRGRRGSRGPRSAAVLEAASAVEGRAVAAAIGEGAGGGGGGGGGGGAPYDDGLPIPDVVHFVFGLEASFGHIKFGLLHYLAVLGARTRIAPRVIKWHYNYIPEGIWWECARPALTLHKVEDVTHVHGKPKAMRVQHKADVLRMQIMLNEGGMYIDSDVIPLRSFQELRRYPLVMGEEADNGLCNAVMLGQPNTTFINRWWAEYVHFEPDKQWAYHSVILPRQLQAEHPEEVTVLSNKAFFWPLWTQLTAMYDEDDGYDYHDNYAVHLWTSADPNKQQYLRTLSIRDIFTGGGSFQRVARQLLVDAFFREQLCPYAQEQVRYFSGNASSGAKRDWKARG